jgi:hypothetical protein
VQASASEAGSREGLPVDGGGVCGGSECLKPQEDKNEEDQSKVDDLRGSPMSVGNLEEIIDENHAIVSSSVSKP